jgi:hypothetical protein
MTIRDVRRNYWRKVDEAESASEANSTVELCHWRGARFTPGSKGRAENCANVRHADLRLGKRQSRCQEAIRLSEQAPLAQASAMHAPVADIISLTDSFRFDITRTDLGSMAGRRSAGISKDQRALALCLLLAAAA